MVRMKRIDQLKVVRSFAFTAKTKKEVQEFAYKIFTMKCDDTLLARTRKADIIDVLTEEIIEQERKDIAKDEAEFQAQVEAWRASKAA